MSRVFISYAREDWDLAARLRERLLAAGHDVFLDTHAEDGIQIGDEWEIQVQDRLLWADAMVCIVTSAYVGSPWCSAEIAIFRWERRGRLLPLNVELGVEHPLLRSVQGADYARDPSGAIAAFLRSLQDLEAGLHRGRSSDGVRVLRDRRGGPSAVGGDAAAGGAVGTPATTPK